MGLPCGQPLDCCGVLSGKGTISWLFFGQKFLDIRFSDHVWKAFGTDSLTFEGKILGTLNCFCLCIPNLTPFHTGLFFSPLQLSGCHLEIDTVLRRMLSLPEGLDFSLWGGGDNHRTSSGWCQKSLCSHKPSRVGLSASFSSPGSEQLVLPASFLLSPVSLAGRDGTC